MTAQVYARFMARDGSGLWEVTSAGIQVQGELWRFTPTLSVICAITPGHTETHTKVTEENDGFGAWAALAVYQETQSLKDAGLAAWALGGKQTYVDVEHREISGTIQLSINGLDRPREFNCSLRYREEGRWVQADAVQAFANATKKAIGEYRAHHI